MLMQLVQDWLGAHVGREGASFMSTAELAAKRKRINDEIGLLAGKEQEAGDQARAEREAEAEAAQAEEQVGSEQRQPSSKVEETGGEPQHWPRERNDETE